MFSSPNCKHKICARTFAGSNAAQIQLHLSLQISAANFVIGGSFLMVPTRGLQFLEIDTIGRANSSVAKIQFQLAT